MDKTRVELTEDNLPEKLAAYHTLTAKLESLEERIRNAERQKGTVSDKIYHKVTQEYHRERDDVKEELDPLRETISAFRKELTGQIEAVEGEIEKLTEELAEAEFRRRVGEYDDAELNAIRDRIAPDMEDQESRKEQLVELLASVDMRRREPAKGKTPDPSTSQAAAAPVKGAVPSEDATASPDKVDAAPGKRVATTAPNVSPEPAASPEGNATPTSTIAVAAGTASSQPATQSSTAVKMGYPNLVVKSGAHQGKRIPLLPMTMTVGREHDNNIEFKDDQVSRYHARIVYEGGNFVIENIDGSTGTWVNETKVTRLVLNEGDTVRIGNTRLAIEVV